MTDQNNHKEDLKFFTIESVPNVPDHKLVKIGSSGWHTAGRKHRYRSLYNGSVGLWRNDALIALDDGKNHEMIIKNLIKQEQKTLDWIPYPENIPEDDPNILYMKYYLVTELFGGARYVHKAAYFPTMGEWRVCCEQLRGRVIAFKEMPKSYKEK